MTFIWLIDCNDLLVKKLRGSVGDPQGLGKLRVSPYRVDNDMVDIMTSNRGQGEVGPATDWKKQQASMSELDISIIINNESE